MFNCFREHNLKLKVTEWSSSRVRSTIWVIMSPRKAYNTVKGTWKLWQNLLHYEPTLKSEPFGAKWDITGNLLKDLLALHNHCMDIFLGMGPAKRMSKWGTWKMHWVPSRVSRRPALWPLFWLLLISTNHFSSKLLQARRTGSCAITETDGWIIPSSSLCELVLTCSLA